MITYGACLDYIAADLQTSPQEVLVALAKAEVLYRIYESRDGRGASILRGVVSNFRAVLVTRKSLEAVNYETP